MTEESTVQLELTVTLPASLAREAEGAVYEKEGFCSEGTLRECLKGAEGFESLVVISMLGHEYTDASL